MYTRYAKAPACYAQKYVEEMKEDLSLDIDDRAAKKLHEERYRYFEILNICVDMSMYLLVLSLRATSKIDKRAHLHVNDGLVGYGRAAMQEMLVIRLRELFQAEKDEPERFRFHGFHQALRELSGAVYPMPNIETNNAIARIIRRRNFYSAHHGDGKKEHSFTKNRLHTLDLLTAVTYIAKVEENLYGGKTFDPFERLLNDELADELQVLCGVYEINSNRTRLRYLKLYRGA